jgi:hypothetical protein
VRRAVRDDQCAASETLRADVSGARFIQLAASASPHAM